MRVTLPRPATAYTFQDQVETRRRLEDAFNTVLQAGFDIRVGRGRLILLDDDDGTEQQITIASGALVVTAV